MSNLFMFLTPAYLNQIDDMQRNGHCIKNIKYDTFIVDYK